MGDFPKLRRADRAWPEENALALLERAEWGVLASCGEGGWPLATPLSYVMDGGDVCFHCALDGHKQRNMAENPRVCFCVVGATQPIYDKDFTTLYESAVVHGRAAQVVDEGEKTRLLLLLCQKYLPGSMQHAKAGISKSLARTAVVRIKAEKINGKCKKMSGAGT